MKKDKTFVFKQNDNIGAADATYDTFLENGFIDNGYIERLTSTKDPSCIVIGRTGSGKTALIEQINKASGSGYISKSITPQSIELQYIANHDYIKKIIKEEHAVDFLFKTIWKHIFIVTIFRTRFGKESDAFKKSWWPGRFSRDTSTQNEAMNYLESYSESFWKDDHSFNIIELTESLEETNEEQKKANASAGIKPPSTPSFNAEVGFNQRESSKTTKTLKKEPNGFNSPLKNEHLRAINKAFQLLDSIFTDKFKSIIITIDELDESWAPNDIKNRFIQALISTTKDFNRLKNIKIILAIRQDLYIQSTTGFSYGLNFKEKIDESITLKLFWNEDHLRELIEKRLHILVSRKYAKDKHQPFQK